MGPLVGILMNCTTKKFAYLNVVSEGNGCVKLVELLAFSQHSIILRNCKTHSVVKKDNLKPLRKAERLEG